MSANTIILTIRRLIIISVPVVLFGCTYIVPLSDRLTYKTETSLQQRFKLAYTLQFQIAQETRAFKLTRYASGFIGGAVKHEFSIGQAFTAYLEQAERILSPHNDERRKQIRVRIVDADLKFTSSWALNKVMDWVRFSLTLETLYPHNEFPRTSTFSREIDLPFEVTNYAHKPDVALVMALESILTEYLDEVFRELART